MTAEHGDPTESRALSGKAEHARWLLLGAVALAVILADQLSKELVLHHLAAGESRALLGPLMLSHIENSGIAFGLFAGATTVVAVVTVAIIGWLLWVFSSTSLRRPLVTVAFALVVGGAVSNLIDRVRVGQVTDFISFPHWPTFNLADTCVCVGSALLLAFFIARELRERAGQQP